MKRSLVVIAILATALAGSQASLNQEESPEIPHLLPLRRTQTSVEHRILSRRARNRNRRLASDPKWEYVPLAIDPGTHYAEMLIGTPPQRESVIVDTGSHILAFPCQDCKECGKHTDAYFNMNNSSSATYVPYESFKCSTNHNGHCGMSQAYTEGSSWKADKVKDLVAFDGHASDNSSTMSSFGVQMEFGCQYEETNLFLTQTANGIIGLSNTGTSLISELKKTGKITKEIFSMCFHEDGGFMTVGGTMQSAVLGPVQKAKMVASSHTSSSWFTVRMLGLKVGNEKLAVKEDVWNTGKGVIVDSGTTETYLSSSASSAFYTLFQKVSQKPYPTDTSPLALTDAEIAALPNLEILLAGANPGEIVTISIPPAQYLERRDDNSGKYVASVLFDETSGGGGSTMTRHLVTFNAEEKLVEFALANCNASAPTAGGTATPQATATGATPSATTSGAQATVNPSVVPSANFSTQTSPPAENITAPSLMPSSNTTATPSTTSTNKTVDAAVSTTSAPTTPTESSAPSPASPSGSSALPTSATPSTSPSPTSASSTTGTPTTTSNSGSTTATPTTASNSGSTTGPPSSNAAPTTPLTSTSRAPVTTKAPTTTVTVPITAANQKEVSPLGSDKNASQTELPNPASKSATSATVVVGFVAIAAGMVLLGIAAILWVRGRRSWQPLQSNNEGDHDGVTLVAGTNTTTASGDETSTPKRERQGLLQGKETPTPAPKPEFMIVDEEDDDLVISPVHIHVVPTSDDTTGTKRPQSPSPASGARSPKAKSPARPQRLDEDDGFDI